MSNRAALLLIIKIVVALSCFALLLYFVDLSVLWSTLKLLTLRSILYLGLIAALLIYISALKWQFFIAELGKRISIFKLFSLYLVGYFFNTAFPSYVGGDLVRSYYVGKEVGQHNALAATILERYTGLVAMLCLGLVAACFSDLVTPAIQALVLLLSLGLLLCSIVAVSERCMRLLKSVPVVNRLESSLRKIQVAFNLARANRRLFVKAMALSFAYHSVTLLNTVVCAAAIGWHEVPLIDLAVVLPLILLVGALPISPSGLGIQEGAFFFFLKGIGAQPEQALAIALVLRAKTLVLGVLGGVLWIGVRREMPVEVPK